MSYQVQEITKPLSLGEGPHWDERTQALYFVDILAASINKYVPATKEHTRTKVGGPHVSFIIPVEGKANQFVVGTERKIVVIQWDGKNDTEVKIVKELFQVDQQNEKGKLNDAKVDSKGRLYTGTIYYSEAEEEKQRLEVDPPGSVFRVDGAEKISTLDTGIQISNGLAFNEKTKTFYYVDSRENRLRQYDWDPDTGNVSNKKYIFDTKKSGVDGILDGGTIDTDGNLWWSAIGDSSVIQLDPNTGKILRKVEVPVKQVTSCTFGGPGLDVLFVTTGSIEFQGSKPPGGSVYMITGLGVKGHPNGNFKL